MALTSARQILNKKILGDGDVQELELEVDALSASVLSIGQDVHELNLDVAALSASVLTIGEKVENATEYSTTEKIIGKYDSDSYICRKMLKLESSVSVNANTWNSTTIVISNINSNLTGVISLKVNTGADSKVFLQVPSGIDSGKIVFLNTLSNAITIDTIIVEYIIPIPTQTRKKTTKKK